MTGTYHNYQQILDFNSIDQKLKQRKIRKKVVISRNGCLSCKRRRKKCDEEKPTCKACIRNNFECNWPGSAKNSVHSINKNNTIQSDSIDIRFFSTNDKATSVVDGDDDEDFLQLDTDFLLDQFLNIQTENNRYTSTWLTDQLIIPSQMDDYEKSCYDAFLTNFLKTITPSYCDPMQLPIDILVPFGQTHDIVMETFIACGASTLTSNDDELQKSLNMKANAKYVKVVNSLIDEIKQSKTGCEDFIFICVQLLQSLCLRDKNIGLNATKSTAHLNASYEIIKKRYLDNHETILTSLDNILLECFITNFPITLLLCRHDKLQKSIPSPFLLFDQLNRIYDHHDSIDDGGDIWTKHPLLGTNFKAYQISAKCSWLYRLFKLPLTNMDFLQKCSNLETESLQNLKEMELFDTQDLSPAKKVSIGFTKSKIYACLILFTIVLNYTTVKIQDLQKYVDLIIEEITICSKLEPNFVHSLWAMFIGGSLSINSNQKLFFTRQFEFVSKCLNSSICIKMLQYLNIIWDQNSTTMNYRFDSLFDSRLLDQLCT